MGSEIADSGIAHHPRQSAAQIAWSFACLLFAAAAVWLNDPCIDLARRFLAAFDLAMHGAAITLKAKPSQTRKAGVKKYPGFNTDYQGSAAQHPLHEGLGARPRS